MDARASTFHLLLLPLLPSGILTMMKESALIYVGSVRNEKSTLKEYEGSNDNLDFDLKCCNASVKKAVKSVRGLG